MLVKNITKKAIDPVIIGKNRVCVEPGEVIDVPEGSIAEYVGLETVKKEKSKKKIVRKKSK